MNNKFAIVLFALPVGMISCFAKSASAAEGSFQPQGDHASVVVAQRYDDRNTNDRRDDNQRNQLRQQELRRNELRREEIRREELRRNEARRVWIPGHWESGFLGIGRHWVEGHWENRG